MINQYFLEVFENAKRQGPGSQEETHKAYKFLKHLPGKPAILDIGCGKGAQSFDLAEITDGHICATDMHKPSLINLSKAVKQKGLDHKITAMVADMAELPFMENQFDLLWAEGSAFIIGYKAALERWKKFIKPGGYLAFSDCVWFKDERPQELLEFWNSEGIEIAKVQDILDEAKSENYELVNHFTVSKRSWQEEFYHYIAIELEKSRKKHADNEVAQKTFDSIAKEIEMYNKYNEYFGYEFYMLRKK